MKSLFLSLAVLAGVNGWAAYEQQPAAAPATPPKPFDCSAPEYRQFDFWVGTWDVVPNPATRPAGAPTPTPGAKPATNIVTSLDGGCVIMENWEAPGQTGHSLNLFDRATRRWHQTWVDSNGGLHQYWGGLKDGNMVFEGEVPLGPGSRFAGRRTVRLTFFPLPTGQVRQFSEALNMDGTWSVNYDLIYTRRQGPK